MRENREETSKILNKDKIAKEFLKINSAVRQNDVTGKKFGMVDYLSAETNDRTGMVAKAFQDMQDHMLTKRYLVVQRASDGLDYEEDPSINVSIVSGKEIQASFSPQLLNEAEPHGMAMETEMDVGYDSGKQYIMDVSGLSLPSQAALLRESERMVEDMWDVLDRASSREDSYEDEWEDEQDRKDRVDEDNNTIEREEEPADTLVNEIFANAADMGAKSPYIAISQSYCISYIQQQIDKGFTVEQANTAEQEVKPVEKVAIKETAKEQVKNEPVRTAEAKETQKEAEKSAEPKEAVKISDVNSKGTYMYDLDNKEFEEGLARMKTAKSSSKKVPAAEKKAEAVVKKEAKENSAEQKANPQKKSVIFFKPGVVKVVQENENAPRSYRIPDYKGTGKDASVALEAKNEQYSFKVLYNSSRFRNWGVLEVYDKNATFPVKEGDKVCGKIGVEEINKISKEKNHEYDLQHKASAREKDGASRK